MVAPGPDPEGGRFAGRGIIPANFCVYSAVKRVAFPRIFDRDSGQVDHWRSFPAWFTPFDDHRGVDAATDIELPLEPQEPRRAEIDDDGIVHRDICRGMADGFVGPGHRHKPDAAVEVRRLACVGHDLIGRAVDLEDRQRAMDEHIRIGREEFPTIHNHTTYSFGIDDQEFMTAFECDEPADFMHLMLRLRDSAASRYTERDVPIFVGQQMPLREALARLDGVSALVEQDR